jgi:hypothetical protein
MNVFIPYPYWESASLDNLPFINTVRRMHVAHHNPEFMPPDFNLTFPICDLLFGTSDAKVGLIRGLFSGMSEKHIRPELKQVVDNKKINQKRPSMTELRFKK